MKKHHLLFLSLIVYYSSSAFAAEFPDIKSPILLEAVNYLNEQGIIKGYPDGTFKPDQVINRAEALKIIFESRGIAVDEDTNSGFPDVDSSLWFAKYVTSAKRLGLINGYADGTYKPTQFVNKAEFLKIAMLAQQYYENPADLSVAIRQYSDLGSNEWYVPYVAFALENNFLDKVSKLSPTAGMTRGEAALIIYRVAKHNETEENGDFDPKDPPPEAFTLLNEYEAKPIDPSLITLNPRANGTTEIISYQSGFKYISPVGSSVYTWVGEGRTVKIEDGDCFTRITDMGELKEESLYDEIFKDEMDYVDGVALAMPDIKKIDTDSFSFILVSSPGYGGFSEQLYFQIGKRYVGINSVDGKGSCLDLDAIKMNLTEL